MVLRDQMEFPLHVRGFCGLVSLSESHLALVSFILFHFSDMYYFMTFCHDTS